ncbi:hypothetical protein DU508_06460 [Pedobacter chinensis]|uniref:Addiction module protein n=1 Tax=Pedobacter chinensis TaxID=2282421 RepID=A0A369PVZ3_9SPHI|nr:hypothetical protein [Pedobacter chinensis]RDC56841.1 hypothetical protein DU508_06460 [Pedobacter chinensis]
MSIEELKIEIAKKVFETDDENLLVRVETILSNINSENDILPEKVKQGINKGLEQAKQGKLIPFNEVKKRLSEKWN